MRYSYCILIFWKIIAFNFFPNRKSGALYIAISSRELCKKVGLHRHFSWYLVKFGVKILLGSKCPYCFFPQNQKWQDSKEPTAMTVFTVLNLQLDLILALLPTLSLPSHALYGNILGLHDSVLSAAWMYLLKPILPVKITQCSRQSLVHILDAVFVAHFFNKRRNFPIIVSWHGRKQTVKYCKKTRI